MIEIIALLSLFFTVLIAMIGARIDDIRTELRHQNTLLREQNEILKQK